MARFGLDSLDLYLIHWPVPSTDRYVDTWRALVRLQAEGRVRSIGVANFHAHHIERIVAETGVTPVREPGGAASVAAAGRAPRVRRGTGHPHRGLVTARARTHPRHAGARRARRQHGRTPAQIVLRWHLQLGNIVIPKASSPARIRENLDVFDFELDADDLAAIAALETGERTGRDPDFD